MVSKEIKSETLFIWVHTAINALPLRMRFVPARSNIRLSKYKSLLYALYRHVDNYYRLYCMLPFLIQTTEKPMCFPRGRTVCGWSLSPTLLVSYVFLWDFGIWLFLFIQLFATYEKLCRALSHMRSLFSSLCYSSIGIWRYFPTWVFYSFATQGI